MRLVTQKRKCFKYLKSAPRARCPSLLWVKNIHISFYFHLLFQDCRSWWASKKLSYKRSFSFFWFVEKNNPPPRIVVPRYNYSFFDQGTWTPLFKLKSQVPYRYERVCTYTYVYSTEVIHQILTFQNDFSSLHAGAGPGDCHLPSLRRYYTYRTFIINFLHLSYKTFDTQLRLKLFSPCVHAYIMFRRRRSNNVRNDKNLISTLVTCLCRMDPF